MTDQTEDGAVASDRRKRCIVTFTITTKERGRLLTFAANEDRSISYVVRRALLEHLARHEVAMNVRPRGKKKGGVKKS